MRRFLYSLLLLLLPFSVLGKANVARYRATFREWSQNSLGNWNYFHEYSLGYVYLTSGDSRIPNSWVEPKNPSRISYTQFVFDKWIYDVPDEDLPPLEQPPFITSASTPIGSGGILPPVTIPPNSPIATRPPDIPDPVNPPVIPPQSWFPLILTYDQNGNPVPVEMNYDWSTGQWLLNGQPSNNPPSTWYNGQQYYIDPVTGEASPVAPPPPSGGDDSGGGDSTPDLSGIAADVSAIRSRLLDSLSAQLGSWVYDLKVDNAALLNLARQSGIKVENSAVNARLDSINSTLAAIRDNAQNPPIVNVSPVVNVQPPVVNVEPPVVNVEVPEKSVDLSRIENTLDLINGKLPENETFADPDDPAVDSNTEELIEGLETVRVKFVEWGNDGASAIDGFGLTGFHSLVGRLFGSVPSFGSDAEMFHLEMDIPYIGAVNKSFSWNDYPAAPAIRSFLLYLVYISFGIAVIRLIFKTVQA